MFLDDKLKTLKSNLASFEDEDTYEGRVLKKKQDTIKNLEIELSRIDVKLNSYLQTLAEEYTMTYEKARNEYQLTEEIEESRKLVNQYKMIIKDLGMVNLQAIEEYDKISLIMQFAGILLEDNILSVKEYNYDKKIEEHDVLKDIKEVVFDIKSSEGIIRNVPYLHEIIEGKEKNCQKLQKKYCQN